MKEIMVFWGATGQSKVLRECMSARPILLSAVFDNNEKLSSPFADVPLYYGKTGFEWWLSKQEKTESIGFLVAIGGDKGSERVSIQEYMESKGLKALTAKHNTAYIAENVKIGNGTQILAHATVCVEVILGRSCIINTRASIDHECILGDGVHVCPGACLAGCVEVESGATIGTGAIILPRKKIGERAMVGAGAVVTKDVPPFSVVVGNPAVIIKRRDIQNEF